MIPRIALSEEAQGQGLQSAGATETDGIVTVGEHTVEGGLGSAVAENLLEAGVIPRFFLRVGVRGFSSIVGSQQYLRKVYSLDARSIARAVA